MKIDEKRQYLKNSGFKFCRRVTSTMRKKKKGRKFLPLIMVSFAKLKKLNFIILTKIQASKFLSEEDKEME